MSVLVFTRRFVADYARNPVNLLLLVVVPVVFVIVVASSLADASKLLGGQRPAVETASAGWAAAFLAGVAMYWALAWTVSAVVLAWVVAVARTRHAHAHRPTRTDTARRQTRAATLAAWRDTRRNPAMWALFVVVPLVFIWTADALTPNEQITLTLTEAGKRVATTFAMPDVHAGTMAPIAIASLAAVVGLFVMADDRRTALAGMRPAALLLARLSVITAAALAATAISLAATAMLFEAAAWPTYAGANVLLALTYALVGALLAPIFGRVGGVFVAFLLPFLDIGVSQSPMLQPDPGLGIKLLPGYGGSRVLLDGALTHTFDETRPLLYGLIWLVVLSLLVVVTYRRSIAPAPTRRLSAVDSPISSERQPQQ